MFVGTERIEIFLPGIRSLKEKRKYLNSIKDRLKTSLNLSLSEISYHELLQRSELGICVVCRDKKSVHEVFQKVSLILKRYPQLEFMSKGVLIEKK